MSESQYKTAKDGISVRHDVDLATCQSLAGNPKDVCIAETSGREKVSKAELEASYAPSIANRFDLSIAQAAAAYAIAHEKCDDLAGNVQDVCRKEAKSAETTARADAELARTTADARKIARDATSDATGKATLDKHDAAYGVAREKCDTLADDAKASCIADAKVVHGQT